MRSQRSAQRPPAKPVAPAGRRIAARRRRGLTGRFPAVPTLIGATALAVAAYGAVGMNHGQLDGNHPIRLSSGQSLNGTDAFAFTSNGPRARAISRDSERQALRDAAHAELKAEAEQQNRQRNAALSALAKSAEKRANQIAKNQWVLPTVGYHLTARFGMAGGLWSSNHTGLDFAAPEGNPIFAVANGVITETGYDGSYGNKTVETLADGTEIWYAHQESIGVNVGDTVTSGQTIGVLGSTGNTTGPHVHIEVRPGGGDPVDPYTAFIYHGITP